MALLSGKIQGKCLLSKRVFVLSGKSLRKICIERSFVVKAESILSIPLAPQEKAIRGVFNETYPLFANNYNKHYLFQK